MAITTQISEEMRKLDEEYRAKQEALREPARKRIEELRKQKAELEREEEELLSFLGEAKKAHRRRSGKRMTAMHKKEILGRFIEQGHIKNGAELTRELRTALLDEGLTTNDFRKLDDYLPGGWTARSNGLRGIAARTVFQRG